jgi:hypothetical protein
MADETRINETDFLQEISMSARRVWTSYLMTVLAKQMQYLGSIVPPIYSTPIDSNKQFIRLEQSFLDQLKKYGHFFEGHSEYLLQEKMKLSADILLNCNPDKISLQVTDEGSIFYTLIKDDITIYFQHYIVDEFDGSDEAIVTVYKGPQLLFNHAGSLTETISVLSTKLGSHAIVLPVFA